MDVAEFVELAESWERHLRASGVKPATIDVYGRAVRQYAEHAGPDAEVSRASLVGFLAAKAEHAAPATVRVRARALSLFCGWLTDEGELDANPLERYRPPVVNTAPVPLLTDAELAAMLAAARAEPDEFTRRRAEALLRTFIDTGCRLSEVVGLTVADVDLRREHVVVHGKGSKDRPVPLGPKTLAAVDRYLRARRKHPSTATPALWLGQRGPLGDDGVDRVLRRLADRAGVEHFHVHRLRHTFAHRWLSRGGQERGLMTIAGWSSPEMLARYGKALAQERALEEARRLNLGDV